MFKKVKKVFKALKLSFYFRSKDKILHAPHEMPDGLALTHLFSLPDLPEPTALCSPGRLAFFLLWTSLAFSK